MTVEIVYHYPKNPSYLYTRDAAISIPPTGQCGQRLEPCWQGKPWGKKLYDHMWSYSLDKLTCEECLVIENMKVLAKVKT